MASSPPTETPEPRDLRGVRRNKGRVFQCTGYPNCNKSFTRSEHLLRHRRKHTGERPFSCPHCAKNFLRLDNLRQHRQTVHAYETYLKQAPEQTPINGRGAQPQTLVAAAKAKINATPVASAASKTESRVVSETPQVYVPMNTCGLPQIRSFVFGAALAGATVPPHQTVSPPLSGLTLYPAFPAALYYPERQRLAPIAPLPSTGGLGLLAAAATLPVAEPRETLREPPKFNPKSRPRPLALAQSYSDDNFHNRGSGSGTVPAVRVDPPLHTAPPLASFPLLLLLLLPYFHDAGRPVLRPLLAGTMVSPLSPLFHQSFNQVVATSNGHGHTLSPGIRSPWVHANVPPANFSNMPHIASIGQGGSALPPVGSAKSLPSFKQHAPVTRAEPADAKPAPDRKVAINNLLSEDPPVAEDVRPQIKVENS